MIGPKGSRQLPANGVSCHGETGLKSSGAVFGTMAGIGIGIGIAG